MSGRWKHGRYAGSAGGRSDGIDKSGGPAQMMDLSSWPVATLVAGIVGAAMVIGVAGTRIVTVVEQISRKTGLGDSLSGALLIGISTSAAGTVLSVGAAWQGQTDLAISNAVGGIVMQTFFLVIGDLAYRRVNIEHAAASLENTMQSALLILLLGIALLVSVAPEWTLLGVSPGSPILLGVYLIGLQAIRKSGEDPQWFPLHTSQTRDENDRDVVTSEPLPRLFTQFVVLLVMLSGAGLILTEMTLTLSARTGLSQSLLGVLLTATITSLPELVTTLTAVRRGALNLAVGNIIGGNTFDVLFLAAADVAWQGGSIFHAMVSRHYLVILTGIVMTAVLILGLLGRQKTGPARIGVESVGVTLIFVVFLALLVIMED